METQSDLIQNMNYHLYLNLNENQQKAHAVQARGHDAFLFA